MSDRAARAVILERVMPSAPALAEQWCAFEAADRHGDRVDIDAAYVDAHLRDLVADQDLTRYIL